MTQTEKSIKKINNIISELCEFIVEREEEIKGVFLAILSQKNLLFVGDPGIAKTMVVDNIAKRIVGAKYFEQAMHSQIKLEELYGPISIRTLEKEDKLVHKTEGMLPEAHFAYLDEFWKSHSGAINSLLKVLNAKVFFNGGKPQQIPLMCLFSSSNEIPEEDDDLAAAYDRFLLKFNVRRVQDKESDLKMHLTNLLDKEREIKHTITLEALQLLQKEVNKVKIGEDIIKTNFYIKRDIEKNLDGAYYINERTSVQSMRVVQAQALLQGRDYVIDEDLEVLKHTYWDDPSQIKEVAKTIISTVSYDKSKLNEIREKLNTIEEFVKSDEDSPEANIRKLSNIERLKTEAMGLKTFLKSNGKSTDEAEKLIGKLTSTAQDLFNASYGG